MQNSLVNWASQVIQEAALNLYHHSSIEANSFYQPLLDELLAAGWLQVDAAQPFTYKLNKAGKVGLKELLDLRLPNWEELLEKYLAGSSQVQVFDQRWNFLSQQLRANLPSRLNLASLSYSLLGKEDAYLSEEFLAQLPKVEPCADLCLHLRGEANLKLKFNNKTSLNLDVLQALTELVISQRDLERLDELEGEFPALVLSVEDRGTFLDMDLPSNQLAIWVNQDNLSLAGTFLRQLPQFVPHIHFGHLDHQGLVLAEYLAQASQRPVKRFIPDFWQEYLDNFAQPVDENQLAGRGAVWQGPPLSTPLLHTLMTQQLWLSQAPLIFDARLYDELRRLG